MGDVSGGTYDMELKAGGGLIDSHFTGNNCDAKSFDLPLGLGKLSWDGIACLWQRPIACPLASTLSCLPPCLQHWPPRTSTWQPTTRTASRCSVWTCTLRSRSASRSDC